MHATRKTNKNLALFDFDGTLCKKDSFTGFIFYALSKRHIVKQGVKLLPWIQAYYLNIYPAHAMRSKLFNAMFSNANADEILELAAEYAPKLLSQLDQDIYQQFLKHKHNDDDIVIVSASIDLYLDQVCQLLDVDLICTKTEIKDKKFTGHYTSPDCSCDQKRLRVLEKYDLNQYQNIYAYGNSKEDLAMLSLASHAYMVGENQTFPLLEYEKKLA
ncbi:HAD-IB family phosphatase [Acinetobacter silvestris]|uniref:Phosphoserine phosphatase n=1 Tax=Acinetobacter silvestris TaxID=1977882 RepID=A0A1Y3CHC2_9GAMM|nr:HAD-IB family phosphatase [Acinetobacter silvestris]OTG66516.1 phosphoserine phosphatase [Acinetobacter silvestris]